MRIVVIGSGGLLGREIVRVCRDAGMTVRGLDLPEVDITTQSTFKAIPLCDWLVNCAAYTDVDGAELECDRAEVLNSTAPGILAGWCSVHAARMMHFSTDYVFDGSLNRPYTETDTPHPLNVYGHTKLAGEKAVLRTLPRATVVRTQALFGAGGRSFVRAIMDQLEKGVEALRVVNDQTVCPTYAVHLADGILRLLRTDRAGIVHCSASGACTWYELAQEIVKRTGRKVDVRAISSVAMNRPAARPPYSVLAKDRFRDWTGFAMPSWREGLDAFFKGVGKGQA